MTQWWSRRTRSSPTAPDAVVVAQDAVDDAQDAPWLGSNDSDGSDDPWLADDTVAAQDRIDTVAAKDPWLDGRDASTTSRPSWLDDAPWLGSNDFLVPHQPLHPPPPKPPRRQEHVEPVTEPEDKKEPDEPVKEPVTEPVKEPVKDKKEPDEPWQDSAVTSRVDTWLRRYVKDMNEQEPAKAMTSAPCPTPTSAPCPTPTSAPASLCEEPEGEDMKEPPAKVRRTRRTVAAPKAFGRGGQWTRRTVAAPKAMPSAASAPRPTPTSAPVDLVESAQKALPAAPKGLRKAKAAPKTLGSFGLRVAYGRSYGIYHKESWSLSTDDIFSAVPRPAPKPTATRHRRRITVAIEDILADPIDRIQ